MLSEDGYFFNNDDGSDLAAYILGIENERDAYKKGLTLERASCDSLRVAAQKAVQALHDQEDAYINLDKVRKQQIKQARTGFGFGLGAGYNPIDNDFGVVLGVIYRF